MVLIESKLRKLNSIELRVELTWRSPCLRTGFEYDPTPYQETSPRPLDPYNRSSKPAPPRPRKPHHLKMKKKKRSHKLDRVRRPSRVECS
ncbi:unnamed protein product [Microthlaspi erraticum]|uniref:Uncharacterized protein n=1 Tax=Microthlaspi erraticum TaxID=1685480 RepID=A0A6D2JNZ6_9BRAS|nr:unnamed protein product [Microthlaspi erraticum]